MKGICFIEPMFNAIIEGRKIQTRRLLPDSDNDLVEQFMFAYISKGFGNKVPGGLIKPCYKVGETVYLKEPYCFDCDFIQHEHAKEWIRNGKVLYKYTGDEISELAKDSFGFGKWKNKLFMPEKYARYFIEITDVRCEKLQDISDKDCMKEGIYRFEDGYTWHEINQAFYTWITPQEAYAALTDKINGKETWESNPYVWVYDFVLKNS